MTKTEEEFLSYYQSQPIHYFRDLEEYARLLEKIQAEADRKLTF